MTFGQGVILAIAAAVLAVALVVRLLLFQLIRKAILAYWARHPEQTSNPYRGFRWLPLIGICIGLGGAALLYFVVLRAL